MTAQPFMPTSPLVGTPCKSMPTAAPVASAPVRSASVGSAPTATAPLAVLEAAQAPDRSFPARIWNAYRSWRNAARMRNMAQDMEPHMLCDVGAPQWLVNEVSVRRELSRLRHVDFIRW